MTLLINKNIATALMIFSAITTSVSINAAQLIPAAPKITATSYIIMDADTGTVIAEKKSQQQFPPASLTKMMTSYITEYELTKGNISLDDKVLVSENAWSTEGSRMFIKEGSQVKLGELLKGIIIQSGNDASVAMAEYIAGSESAFASLMNQHAKLLGMDNTFFSNATGLPSENHYSSPYDLAKLSRAIIQKFPQHYGIYSEKYFTYNNIRQPNRNKLLWRDKTVDGLKTGHTNAAGYCLVASAKRDGMRLITVVLGTKSEEARARESQKLLAYGFRFYRTHQLYEAKKQLSLVRVWGGQESTVRLGVGNALSVTIPRGQAKGLKATMDINTEVRAPVVAGQSYGVVRISLDGKEVKTVPLVALNSVAEGGFFKKTWDGIVLFFIGLLQ
ncbi:MAG: D-alanyl-D-alanine carboxypeptidase [Osedax symbiont Rs1]|nr:MAG: D-alanyl-D-alanine carboxypeptidase [Osedax symbiont Rs1]